MSQDREQPSGMAIGITLFAGTMLVVVGILQLLEGLAALVNGDFFLRASNYTFDVDTSAYGWTHLIIGIILVLVGTSVLARRTWARIVGIGFACLSMFANFLFIPYYPVWSVLIIGLNVAIIWALAQAPE